MIYFGLLCFVYTPRLDVQGMFLYLKNALDLMDFKRILLAVKIILQA